MAGMSARHAMIATALLLLIAAISAGCGGDDGGPSDRSDEQRSAERTETAESKSAEDAARSTSVASFAETPELRACMDAAGFAEDAPPTGGIKAWRHTGGARAVVGSGPDVTKGIAAEIGTQQAPAAIDGDLVLAGPAPQRAAAAACLD